MQVRAWRSGSYFNPSTVYGIWVGRRNRAEHFQSQWDSIFVELDGQVHTFRLTPSFHRRCIEFRDAGVTTIRDWLERHHTIDWQTGHPPRFELQALGAGRFRLIP